MVESDGLENRCGACVTVGSNPTLSAINASKTVVALASPWVLPHSAGSRPGGRIPPSPPLNKTAASTEAAVLFEPGGPADPGGKQVPT